MAAAALSSGSLKLPGLSSPSPNPKLRRRSVIVKARYTQQNQDMKQAFSGDSYSALGLNPGSSKSDIKQAYRRLALQYHPDVCKGDHCVPKFKQINAAYELLQQSVQDQLPELAYDEYDSDDEEEYKTGWEGAWVF